MNYEAMEQGGNGMAPAAVFECFLPADGIIGPWWTGCFGLKPLAADTWHSPYWYDRPPEKCLRQERKIPMVRKQSSPGPQRLMTIDIGRSSTIHGSATVGRRVQYQLYRFAFCDSVLVVVVWMEDWAMTYNYSMRWDVMWAELSIKFPRSR